VAKNGQITLIPYRFEPRHGDPADAEWGTLTVPENRRGKDSNPVTLAFVRFPATTADPGHPIVYLASGPGESGIEAARGGHYPIFMALREVADVIALDQRGTGASLPSLRCEAEGAWRLPLDRPVGREEALAIALDQSRVCAARLRDDGIDLDGYNAVENADDIDDLRTALGAEKLDLWGMSYGTHLALATLRRHAGRIGRCVLGGAEGPDHTYKLPSIIQRQLENIGDLVRVDPVWGGRISDFVALVEFVLEGLELEPATVEIRNPYNGHTVRAGIGRFEVEYMTAVGLADTRIIALLPSWYQAMSNGDYSMIARESLLSKYLLLLKRGLGRNAMSLLMDCASGATQERWERIEREAADTVLGRTVDFPFPEIGEAWGRPDLGDEYRAPVRADNPVLFLSGSLDCRTPLDNVVEVLSGLPQGQYSIVLGAGHADVFLSCPEVEALIAGFFRGKELDARIYTADPPFRFQYSAR
jgi:pimeloyl-ACP methyl ester carboxylesterase